ncbi:MAG: hypothetical protein ACRCXT_15335 [Paraclostridium sp.]
MYLSNNIIKLSDHTKLKGSEGLGIDGNMVDISLIKSRSARAGKSITLVYDPVRGFDKELSLLQLLKAHKRINGAGAYLYIGEYSDHKFSQKKFKEKLYTEPEFRDIVMKEVQAVLIALIEIAPEVEEDYVGDMNTSILGNLTRAM